MSRNIFVDNKSGHKQEFAHSRITIRAPDGSSGAIIALHDGHEGEQAEITKNGFGGEFSFRKRAPTLLGLEIGKIRNKLANLSL
jgi:hypothetical protein